MDTNNYNAASNVTKHLSYQAQYDGDLFNQLTKDYIRLVKNSAETIFLVYPKIKKEGNDYVVLLGTGYESCNQEAVEYWVKAKYLESDDSYTPRKLLDDFADELQDQIEIFAVNIW